MGGSAVRWRLAGLMALIYAVMGAWWPLISIHMEDLHIPGRARGVIFGTYAVASILTPPIFGMLADRKIASQKLLAIIYAFGAGLLVLFGSGWVTTAGPLLALTFAYWLLTAPAAGLGASLSLRNLDRPKDQFGSVRLWGTISWMVVGWVVSGVMALHLTGRQGAFEAFWVAAVFSTILAGFALTLPDTPPLVRESERFSLRETFALARRRPVAIYLLLATGVCLTTPYPYLAVPPYLRSLGMPTKWVGSAMTLGQPLEIVFLALLPKILGRVGMRKTLALGILGWVGYYAILSARLPLGASLLAIPLNGVAIACFHVAGQMYIDGEAPPERRAGAQSLYLVATVGVGTLCGSILAGEVIGHLGSGSARVFLVPLGIDATLLVALLVGFRPGERPSSRNEVGIAIEEAFVAA